MSTLLEYSKLRTGSCDLQSKHPQFSSHIFPLQTSAVNKGHVLNHISRIALPDHKHSAHAILVVLVFFFRRMSSFLDISLSCRTLASSVGKKWPSVSLLKQTFIFITLLRQTNPAPPPTNLIPLPEEKLLVPRQQDALLPPQTALTVLQHNQHTHCALPQL